MNFYLKKIYQDNFKKEATFIKNLIIKRQLNITLKDGTFKTSNPNRINASLNLLLSNIKNTEKLNILEIGPSYGFTTVDIFNFFSTRNLKIDLCAYEKNLYIEFIKIFRNYLLFEKDFFIGIYIKFFNLFFLMQPKRKNVIYSISSKLIQILWKIIFSLNIFKNVCLIKLLNDEIYKNNIYVTNKLEDLNKKSFNIIICLNVLNKSYYSFEESREYLSQYCNLLEDNGILLLGRNHDEDENVSLFKYSKKEKKLIFSKRIKNGWDYEEEKIFLENI